jgi:hypothetical protein
MRGFAVMSARFVRRVRRGFWGMIAPTAAAGWWRGRSGRRGCWRGIRLRRAAWLRLVDVGKSFKNFFF